MLTELIAEESHLKLREKDKSDLVKLTFRDPDHQRTLAINPSLKDVATGVVLLDMFNISVNILNKYIQVLNLPSVPVPENPLSLEPVLYEPIPVVQKPEEMFPHTRTSQRHQRKTTSLINYLIQSNLSKVKGGEVLDL